MEEAGVSDSYSDGNKAGFLTTDCHFLYVWFPSLPTLLPVRLVIQGAIPELKDWEFCSLSIQNCSPRLPTAHPQSRCTVHGKKMRRMHFHAPLGTTTIQFFSNRCHISAILWRSHATRGCGCVGGGKEQRNDARCLLTDSVVRIRPSVPRCTDASCTHTAKAYIFHIFTCNISPLQKSPQNTQPPTFVYTKIKVIGGEFIHSSTEASIIFLLSG